MKTFTIEIEGNTPSDIEQAIDRVAELIKQTYLSGFDSNDTGSFNFNSTGDYEPEEETEEEGDEADS